jgi:hypothetical protein
MKYIKTILIILVLTQVFLQGCSTRHEKVLATAVNPSGFFKAEFVESKVFYLFSKKYFLKMTNTKTQFNSQQEINTEHLKSNPDTSKVKLIWESDSHLEIYLDNNLVMEEY